MKHLFYLITLILPAASLSAVFWVPGPHAKDVAAQLEADRKSASGVDYVGQTRTRLIATQVRQLQEAVQAYVGESLKHLSVDSREEKLWQERLAVAKLKFQPLLDQTIAYEKGDEKDLEVLRTLASQIAAHFAYLASLIGHTNAKDPAHCAAAAQLAAAYGGRGGATNGWITKAHYPQACAAAETAFRESAVQVQGGLSLPMQQNILRAYSTVARPFFELQLHTPIPGSHYQLPAEPAIDQGYTQLAQRWITPEIYKLLRATIPTLPRELVGLITQYSSFNLLLCELVPFLVVKPEDYGKLQLRNIGCLDGLGQICNADKLEELDLSGNPQMEAPGEAFAALKNLKELTMTNCGLRTVPLDAWLATCEQLNSVDLKNNAIQRVADLGQNFEMVLSIRQEGEVSQRDPVTGQFTGTRFILQLAGNPIAENEAEMKRLREVFKRAGKAVGL